MDRYTQVFVTARDIGLFSNPLETLMANLLLPQFSWYNGAKLYTENVVDGDNHTILMALKVTTGIQDVPLDQTVDASSFLEFYVKYIGATTSGILGVFSPTVSESALSNAGLASEQLLIQLVQLYTKPYVVASHYGEEMTLEMGVDIYLTLVIEDMSGFEPGGIVALTVRFRYLCGDRSEGTIEELRQWVSTLPGAPEPWAIAKMNKGQLCQILRVKYGF